MSEHFQYPDVVDVADEKLRGMESMTNPYNLKDHDDCIALRNTIHDYQVRNRPFRLVDVGKDKVEIWAKSIPTQ